MTLADKYFVFAYLVMAVSVTAVLTVEWIAGKQTKERARTVNAGFRNLVTIGAILLFCQTLMGRYRGIRDKGNRRLCGSYAGVAGLRIRALKPLCAGQDEIEASLAESSAIGGGITHQAVTAPYLSRILAGVSEDLIQVPIPCQRCSRASPIRPRDGRAESGGLDDGVLLAATVRIRPRSSGSNRASNLLGSMDLVACMPWGQLDILPPSKAGLCHFRLLRQLRMAARSEQP
ncbi:MAG: hypothetical protein P8182_13755 [Deltaproteobacteria bacterium]